MERAAPAVDGRATARPTCWPSRWTSCRAAGGSATSRGDAEPGPLLGDVVLCPEVAAEQAGEAGHSAEDELHLLCTHGILHLLGYDHADPDEEREMFELQARLLASWRSRPRRRDAIRWAPCGAGRSVSASDVPLLRHRGACC